MSRIGNPRDLDPKFKEEPNVKPTEPTEPEVEPTEPTQIVYRQNVTNPDGTAGEILHGPMPVEEWATYEKEHNL